MKERTKFLKKIIIQELPINSESFNAIQAKLEKIHHGLAIRDWWAKLGSLKQVW